MFPCSWQTLEELECHGPVMSEQTRAELEQKIDEARESIRKAEVRRKFFCIFSSFPQVDLCYSCFVWLVEMPVFSIKNQGILRCYFFPLHLVFVKSLNQLHESPDQKSDTKNLSWWRVSPLIFYCQRSRISILGALSETDWKTISGLLIFFCLKELYQKMVILSVFIFLGSRSDCHVLL